MEEKDVLVIGGGVAGHVFTHYLRKNKKRVTLYDKKEDNVSSRIAAGLFNPIVLKRLNLAWKAHETVDVASSFYATLEEELGASFFHKMPLLRIFADHEEANNWQVKSQQHNYRRFIDPNPDVELPKEIDPYFGVGKVKEAGFMDMSAFFEASEKSLHEHRLLVHRKIDYTALTIKENGVLFENTLYKKVVFCEGVGVLKNPFFNYLPVQPNKGDILTIKSTASMDKSQIFSKSMFLIPLGEGKLRAGSTYQRKWDINGPDPEKRDQIVARMGQFFKGNMAVVKHDWGLRPTVTDRRPIVGKHSQHKSLYVMNGLGSRGVLMAPLLAQLLYDSIYSDKAIPEDINSERFNKFFNI